MGKTKGERKKWKKKYQSEKQKKRYGGRPRLPLNNFWDKEYVAVVLLVSRTLGLRIPVEFFFPGQPADFLAMWHVTTWHMTGRANSFIIPTLKKIKFWYKPSSGGELAKGTALLGSKVKIWNTLLSLYFKSIYMWPYTKYLYNQFCLSHGVLLIYSWLHFYMSSQIFILIWFVTFNLECQITSAWISKSFPMKSA